MQRPCHLPLCFYVLPLKNELTTGALGAQCAVTTVPRTQGQSAASRGRCPTAATHPDDPGSPSQAHSQQPGARGPCSASIHVTS